MNDTKICLLGGDTRQWSLARLLSGQGYEVAVWGLPPCDSAADDFTGVQCAEAEGALSGSRAVILPLPASQDGVRIHRTAAPDELVSREMRLTELIEKMPPRALLLAGMPGEVLRAMARNANIKLIDYYDCETVQLKNAIPTAEGAIALAMSELPVTLYGTHCAVLGYGRIGRRLSDMLLALGARVSVAARSEKSLTEADIAGCYSRPLSDFLMNPGDPAVIFNTVPTPIIEAETLERLPAETVYIELASAPGGIEAGARRRCPIRLLRAPSLPAQIAPRSAARILFESILSILQSEGVRV